MILHKETFGAGERKRFHFAGRYFNLLAAPSTVDVRFAKAGATRDTQEALGMVPGFWDADPAGFTSLDLVSAGAGVVEFVVSSGTSGVLRIGGNVSTSISQPTALTMPAAVVVGTSAVAIFAANASRKLAWFRNASATQNIALGPSGVTIADSPLILQPGQVYADEIAAGVAWFAIASAAAGSLQSMEAS